MRLDDLYDWAEKIWQSQFNKNNMIIHVLNFSEAVVNDTVKSPYIKLAEPPKEYFCSKCKKKKVRLWRQYNTFTDYISLLCKNCAEKDQEKSIKESEKVWEKIGSERPKSDQIGGLVPAVPDYEGSYWGYTSVPSTGVLWWKSLPEN